MARLGVGRLLTGVAASAMMATTAVAAEKISFEEITVTARQRTESLMDVPPR